MVCKSYTSIRPHIVTIFDSGKVVCDCKNNDNLCICAHSIAVNVAEKAGQLKKLIEWYKKSKQSANLWKLSRSSNVPKQPGAKPNQRQPRKTKNRVPVLSCSDTDETVQGSMSCAETSPLQQHVPGVNAELNPPHGRLGVQITGAHSKGMVHVTLGDIIICHNCHSGIPTNNL